MKFSFPHLFVMVFVAVQLSKVVEGQGSQKNCQKPKGTEGESWTEGCIRQTCKDGVWMATLEKTVCCYEREAVTPNKNIITTTSQDGCTTTTLDCTLDDGQAKMVFSAENSCPKPATENQIEELTQMLEEHAKTNHCSCGSRTGTTTTPAPTRNTNIDGIFITGGSAGRGPASGVVTSEVFIPETGKTCSLPNADLPDDRSSHTMDTLGNTPVVCGGKSPWTVTSCLHFTPTSASGVWTNYATTLESRETHSSWVSSAGLVLLGGWHSVSTEMVPSGGGNFSLEGNARSACAIADKDSVIITGGNDGKTVSSTVARYNLQGHVENLPEMNQGRSSHGCGSYISGGTMVLVVAGGDHGGKTTSSTEKLPIGATAWTTAATLPRRLTYVPSVSMNNRVYIIGGYCDGEVRGEILAFDGEDWTEVGQLKVARASHAATKIDTFTMVGVCN
eukprot:GFUD01011824.1.p1 GENE.GFUD01011824.1~~GFUD01011824.1.p1  ORF type:complete len:447 (+),score=101.01 GFUD01011824.1:59-1399(+)